MTFSAEQASNLDSQALMGTISDEMMNLWDSYGWRRGDLGSEDTGFCALGAWRRVTGDANGFLATLFGNAFVKSIDYLQFKHKHGAHNSVINFNDCDDTSFEDVQLVTKHACSTMADTLASALQAFIDGTFKPEDVL